MVYIENIDTLTKALNAINIQENKSKSKVPNVKKVTLSQIAKQANVSVSTVSRALSQHPAVNADIRQQIISLAHQLGYQPKTTQDKQVVGLIIPTQKHTWLSAYLSQLMGHLTLEIYRRQYSMELVMADDIKLLQNSFLKGAILLTPHEQIESQWAELFDIPLVGINVKANPDAQIHAIGSNEKQGIQLAVRHLFENNHRRIGLITFGREAEYNNAQRRKHFQKTAEELRMGDQVVIHHIEQNQNYFEHMGKVLRRDVTALICAGEDKGMYASYVLYLFGKKIPDDISLITFEHEEISCYCSPPQTTLGQNFGHITQAALDMLEQPSGKRPHASDGLIDYQLHERDSVRKLPL